MSFLNLIPRRLISVRPSRLAVGLRYRIFGFTETDAAKPETVMHAIAPRDDEFRQMSFTFATIALSAAVARANGPMTREKYLAFRDAFPLLGGFCGKIRSLFTLAYSQTMPIEHYVNQIKYTFPRKRGLFKSLVERLFSIAAANGTLTREDERLLAKISRMLELSPADFTAIHERYLNPKPHQILGLEKRSRADALKKRYHELMRRYHPDRHAAHATSPEVQMLLRLKVSEINEAYRVLSRKAA